MHLQMQANRQWAEKMSVSPSLLAASGCHMAAGRNLMRSQIVFQPFSMCQWWHLDHKAITISIQLLALLPAGRTAILSVGSNKDRVVISTPHPPPIPHGDATGLGGGPPQLNSLNTPRTSEPGPPRCSPLHCPPEPLLHVQVALGKSMVLFGCGLIMVAHFLWRNASLNQSLSSVVK